MEQPIEGTIDTDDNNIPPRETISEEGRTKAIVEALVIATTEPLPLREIAQIANVSEDVVRGIIDELNKEYRDSARAFEIKEIAGGFQIYTLPKFAEWVGALHKRKEKLSKAALETLAIVAYHQPIIRADIEKIRGVDTTSVLDTLLQKNLIKTCGRLPSPGRPIKYGTTKEFLRYFGIKDISELPKEEDFGEPVVSNHPEPEKVPAEAPSVDMRSAGSDVEADAHSIGPDAEKEPQEDEIIDFSVEEGEEADEMHALDEDSEPQGHIPNSDEGGEQTEDLEETEDKSGPF
jgi:segregation and condensation protein B